MGNCQAAEAATVLIQHPSGNKIERICFSVTASEVMSSNPGHYIALVVTSPTTKWDNGIPVKQLMLLRPDDALVLGQVYRLISFEDVLKEFSAKKCVKLGKLLKQRDAIDLEKKKELIQSKLKRRSQNCASVQAEQKICRLEIGNSTKRGVGRHQHGDGGQWWRPALESIAEVET